MFIARLLESRQRSERGTRESSGEPADTLRDVSEKESDKVKGPASYDGARGVSQLTASSASKKHETSRSSFFNPLRDFLVKASALRVDRHDSKEFEQDLQRFSALAVEESGLVGSTLSRFGRSTKHLNASCVSYMSESTDIGKTTDGNHDSDVTYVWNDAVVWERLQFLFRRVGEGEMCSVSAGEGNLKASEFENVLQNALAEIHKLISELTKNQTTLLSELEAHSEETEQRTKQTAHILVGRWMNAVAAFDKIAECKTQPLRLKVIDSLSRASAEMKLRLEKSMFAHMYMSCFLHACSCLKEAQHILYTQKPEKALKCLIGVKELLLQCGQINGVWIFRGASRHYLANKLNFLLEALVPTVLLRLQTIMEELEFGGISFASRYDAASAAALREHDLPHRLTALWECESLFNIATSLNTILQEPPTKPVRTDSETLEEFSSCGSWVALVLASAVILRFHLLFLMPSSPLAQTNTSTEAFKYIRSCVVDVRPRLAEMLSRSHIDVNVRPNIQLLFSHCVAEELHQFAYNRCRAFQNLRNATGPVVDACVDQMIQETLEGVLFVANELASDEPSCVSTLLGRGSRPITNSIVVPSFLNTTAIKQEYYRKFKMKTLDDVEPTGWGDDLGELLAEDKEDAYPDDDAIILTRTPKSALEGLNDDQCDGGARVESNTCVLDALCAFDRDRLLCFFEENPENAAITQSCTLFLPHSDPSVRLQKKMSSVVSTKHQAICTVSQRIRALLEAIMVVYTRRKPVMVDSVCAEYYAKHVFEPVLRCSRFALRDAWNWQLSPVASINESCIILNSFQVVLYSLDNPTVFQAAIYLSSEFAEWRRLLKLAQKMFVDALLKHLGFSMSRITYTIFHETVSDYAEASDIIEEPLSTVSWVRIVHGIQEALGIEPLRSEVLVGIGEAMANMTWNALMSQINVLYADQQVLFAQHCSLIIDVFSPLVSQPLQHALDRLKDIQWLLTEPGDVVRELLQQSEMQRGHAVLSEAESEEAATNSAKAPSSSGVSDVAASSTFFGVKWMMEAENLIKKSKQSLLRPKSLDVGQTATTLSNPATCGAPFEAFHHKIKVITYKECCEVLRKRREFFFSTSHGFHPNE